MISKSYLLNYFRVIFILNFILICKFSNGQQDFQFESNRSVGGGSGSSRNATGRLTQNSDYKITLGEPSSFDTIENNQYKFYEKEIAKCGRDENKILLSFILRSHQWNEIIDKKKDKAINKLSKFFLIPKNFVSLDNVSRKEIFEMTQLSLRRGLSRLNTENSRNLGRLQFMVGCGKLLFPAGQSIANKIGEQMANGAINEISGLEFGFWTIWTKSADTKSTRNKRQIDEGSGLKDSSYNYDDEEDDYTDEEEITEVPSETNLNKQKHRHHHGETQNIDSELKSTEPINNYNNNKIDHNSIISKTETTVPTRFETNYVMETSKINDDDIKESLSKLESDISKTIENNTNKLKEAEEEIQNIINENLKKHHNSVDQVLEDVIPIFEAISEDDQIEIETKKPFKIEDDYVVEDILNYNNKKLNKDEEVTTFVTVSSDYIPSTANLLTTSNLYHTTTPGITYTTSSTLTSSAQNAIPSKTFNNYASTTTTVSAKSSSSSSSLLSSTQSNQISPLDTTSSHSLLTTENKLNYLDISKTNKLNVFTDNDSIETTTNFPIVTTLQDEIPYPSTTEQNSISTTDRLIVSSDSGFRNEPKVRFSENYNLRYYTTTDRQVITTTEDSILPIFESGIATTPESDYNPDEYDDGEEYDDDSTIRPLQTTTEKVIIPVSDEFVKQTTTTEIPTTSTTQIITTTTIGTTSTEYIEIDEPVNTNPIIKSRMPKQPLTAGKPFSLRIPLDIFYDSEDGTNLKLELLDKYDNPLKASSWIQFDTDKREIYGLPLEDSVSKWIFHLRASDSGDKFVTETLDLVVQQHKTHRSDNHEIHIGVKLIEKFKSNVDWQIRLIRGIAETLGETSIGNIVVREIRTGSIDSSAATFVYTNETLPKDFCPEDLLNKLVRKLNIRDLNDSLSPEIVVKTVQGEMIGACKKATQQIIEISHASPKRYPPMPRNAVDFVNATAGQLLVFRVPSDTFFDPDDQPLKLSLLTSERSQIDQRNWLQFDSKNQEFYGVPKNYDIGQREYLLVAENLAGLTANDALVVIVKPAPKRDYSTLFEMTLGTPFENFNNSGSQRRFVEKMAKLFEDATTSNIQVRSVRPHYGYTLISFYNATLYRMHQRCPDDEIEILRNILLYPDGSLRDRARDVLGTEFNLLNVSLVPVGTCQGFDTIHHDLIPVRTEEPPASKLKDDYLLTFVLPAVIIIAMLLFASIIACYLHRRHLTGKMELGDEEERRSFRSKGIPVIFQDELDEKPEIGNKSPVILKDEKPPLLPPSYTSNNPDENDDVDDYVPPPAVMMGGRESRGKSPVTPSYRKPPPYVSP